MSLLWTVTIRIIKLPNAAVHDNDNWICNNFEMRGRNGKEEDGANKRLKCYCPRQRQLKKFKNQMPLFKTVTIESNSNPQFVIVTFELLKVKTLSRTMTFAKHTSLDISLIKKLNSSFFFP